MIALATHDDSERSRAEERLRTSEAQLRATFDQAAVGLAHVGLDGRWLRVNDRLCTMLGYTRDELLEKTFQQVTYPDDLEADLACLRQLLAGQITTCTQEKRYVRGDGSLVWGNLAVSLVLDASGAPQHFVWVIEDISERKRSEAALHDLLTTLDLANLMARDLDGTIRFWSEGCERLYGWTAAEAVGRNAHELLHTRFPMPLAEVEAALKREGEWRGDLRQRARDGRELVVTARKRLRRDADEGPVAILESLEDVTAQRQAEAARAKSEATLGAVLDALPVGVVIADATGRILRDNAAHREMWGEATSATSWEEYGAWAGYWPDTGERIQADRWAMARALLGGEVVTGELVEYERSGAGERRCFLNNAAPVLDPSGAVIAGVAAELDVTDARRAEQELRESEARLNALQAELLHVSRLSAAGEMASALAHELNQPLTAIVNYLGAVRRLLTREGHPVAELQEFVDLAVEQGLRAGQIIRRLRSFVAKSGGERRSEDLPQLIREASLLASVGLKERGVAITLHLPPVLPPVIVDRIQIQQVLINLLRNAAEALAGAGSGHDPGAGEIAVRAELAGPGVVEVAVADTGPGLSPDIVGQLFQPFVTTKPHGMGVGLSISRTIVEMHGGRLWAEPNGEAGTVFRFTVPCLQRGLDAGRGG